MRLWSNTWNSFMRNGRGNSWHMVLWHTDWMDGIDFFLGIGDDYFFFGTQMGWIFFGLERINPAGAGWLN